MVIVEDVIAGVFPAARPKPGTNKATNKRIGQKIFLTRGNQHFADYTNYPLFL